MSDTPTPPPPTERCWTCKYWRAENPWPDGTSTHLGNCKRHAPAVVEPSAFVNPGSPRTVWPITWESDWCGDFTARNP